METCQYCGREFETKGSLRVHFRHCKNKEHIYDPALRYISKYKTDHNTFKCECGMEFDNNQRFSSHCNVCDTHRISTGKNIYKKPYKNHNWTKTEENKEKFKLMHIKSSATLREKYKNGEIKPAFLGRFHTPETKEKMRQAAIRRLQNKNVSANYSKVACEFMDNLSKEKGWNLIHALNGHEKVVHGFYLDGYDESLNIAFEYDERKHYVGDPKENVLRFKDRERQNIIIKELKCKMFRYNEESKQLYEVFYDDSIENFDLKKAIDSNLVDLTSRMSIRRSMIELGFTIGAYDYFADTHPEYGLPKYPKKKPILKTISHEEMRERRRNIFECIKTKYLKLIDSSKDSKIAQIHNLFKKDNQDVSCKLVRNSIKEFGNQEIKKLFFNSNNKHGSLGQIWITNPKTKERKRIKEIDKLQYIGWKHKNEIIVS